jgi:hypothetical protein
MDNAVVNYANAIILHLSQLQQDIAAIRVITFRTLQLLQAKQVRASQIRAIAERWGVTLQREK